MFFPLYSIATCGSESGGELNEESQKAISPATQFHFFKV